MKAGLSIIELAREIERRAEAKRDFIAPAPQMKVEVDAEANAPRIVLDGQRPMAINQVAHGQLAEYAGIPMPYYRRMLEQEPSLLATNVNRWLQDAGKAQERRMVRTLDGNVRAVLSDKYRPLENEQLAEAILPVLMNMNLMILSSQITETRLYIKAVDRNIEKDVPTGRKIGDGSHCFFDTLSPGITISNSEVGYGALSIETCVYTKMCTNMATFGASLRKYHTGGRAELSDGVYQLLTDQTKRLTDAAVWAQTRDLVAAAFDRAKFDALTDKIQAAAEDRIEADVVKVVEVVGQKYGLNQGERKGVLATLIEGGDLSRYGLHGAMTRYSQDVEDYDRATEFEKLGGKIIELPKNQWEEVLKQAA